MDCMLDDFGLLDGFDNPICYHLAFFYVIPCHAVLLRDTSLFRRSWGVTFIKYYDVILIKCKNVIK